MTESGENRRKSGLEIDRKRKQIVKGEPELKQLQRLKPAEDERKLQMKPA